MKLSKSASHNLPLVKASKRKQEQGITLFIAMLMALVLLPGVAGLLQRYLIARKSAASESFQQLADAAALNGFNRILGELNENNQANYRGFLFTLNHNDGSPSGSTTPLWGWNENNRANFELRELCTDRTPMPQAVLANSDAPAIKDITNASTTLRDDGKSQSQNPSNDGNIQLNYRLRSYDTSAGGNKGVANGLGTFEVEGFAQRIRQQANPDILARTYLQRQIFVDSRVDRPQDWAVLAGSRLDLGKVTINGDGLIFLHNNNLEDSEKSFRVFDEINCGNSIKLRQYIGVVGNTSLDKTNIIPIKKNVNLPPLSLWDLDKTLDINADTNQVRIWSFDDSGPNGFQSSVGTPTTICNANAFACVRDYREPVSIRKNSDVLESSSTTSPDDIIRLAQDDICIGVTKGSCHIYVEHIRLKNKRLLIETSADKPVVVRLELPPGAKANADGNTITGSIRLEKPTSGTLSQICGVDPDSNVCNEKPEQLIILSSARVLAAKFRKCAQDPFTISKSDKSVIVSFYGDSIPAATIHLQDGSVRTSQLPTETTTFRGLIWANDICNKKCNFNLVTKNNVTLTPKAVVEDLIKQWDWENLGYPGHGRLVTRGFRGLSSNSNLQW